MLLPEHRTARREERALGTSIERQRQRLGKRNKKGKEENRYSNKSKEEGKRKESVRCSKSKVAKENHDGLFFKIERASGEPN